MSATKLSGLIAAAVLLSLATPAIFAATTTKDVEIVVTHPGSWGPEIALGSGWGVIRASGDILHLAYADASGTEVHYRRSSDQGNTWTADQRIATNAELTPTEALATSGSDVYLIYLWNMRNGGNACGSSTGCPAGNIYFLHSADGGATWGTPCQLTTTDDVYRVSIDATSSRVDVVWGTPGGPIYYRGSSSHGACSSWGATRNIGGTNATRPRVASAGRYIHVVWEGQDAGRPGCYALTSCPDNYYVRSTNEGASFETPQHITRYPPTRVVIGRPAITVLPAFGTVVFFYEDLDAWGNQQIYSQISSSAGAAGSWSAPAQITNSALINDHPVAAAADNTAFIDWTNLGQVNGVNNPRPWFSMGVGGSSWTESEEASTQNLYATSVTATSNWTHFAYSPFSGGPLYYRRRAR